MIGSTEKFKLHRLHLDSSLRQVALNVTEEMYNLCTTEDNYKNHIKEKISYDMAHDIYNKITFTQQLNRLNQSITIFGRLYVLEQKEMVYLLRHVNV